MHSPRPQLWWSFTSPSWTASLQHWKIVCRNDVCTSNVDGVDGAGSVGESQLRGCLLAVDCSQMWWCIYIKLCCCVKNSHHSFNFSPLIPGYRLWDTNEFTSQIKFFWERIKFSWERNKQKTNLSNLGLAKNQSTHLKNGQDAHCHSFHWIHQENQIHLWNKQEKNEPQSTNLASEPTACFSLFLFEWKPRVGLI